MMSLTPNSTPQDVTYVREILELVTDKDAAMKRLDELQKAAEQATAAVDEQHQNAKELAQKLAEYEALSTKLHADQQAFDAYNKTRGEELATMAASLNDRVREFETREHDSLASLAAREQAVGNRERKVQAREDAVAEREQKANALMSAANEKMAQIRAWAS